VLPKRGFYSRDALDTLFSAAGLPAIVPVIECDSFESNLSVVAATKFITIAPEFAARRFERLRMVKILRTKPSLGSSPVMLQYLRGQEQHPAFSAFRTAALKAARLVGSG
jgi:DNA-binding transcriptional LysR family regulator